jgi:mono/diheme cytochrome c family protein
MGHVLVRGAIPLILAGLALNTACQGDPGEKGSSGGSDQALIAEGRQGYEATCAACHGTDLKGTATGPPFLSPIYAPNHHPDAAFFNAAANGVQPHHWQFGPMPALPAVSEDDVRAIVAYVRAEQAEAGITEDPSHP